MTHLRLRALLVLAALAIALPASLGSGYRPVLADSPTVSVDQLRTGWDGNEPNLTVASVQSGTFGRLWGATVDGVVNARPVTAHGVVIVATEHDKVYAYDETFGAPLWVRTAGTYGDDHGCSQVSPSGEVGITSTPVIDPANYFVYVMARDWHGPTGTHWLLHRYGLFDGSEAAGWPVSIAGSATNVPGAPGLAFDSYAHEQRPGLLLLGSTVVAGFGSFCDQGTYQGWISTVSTVNGAQRLYTDVPNTKNEGAFWASGSGFVADSPNSFIATSANPPTGSGAGQAPIGTGPPTAGTDLSDAVIRLQLGGDGLTITPTDYFSPFASDTTDLDLGSSGFAALPDGFGSVSGHPHLGVVGGKFGKLYVLDRDHLGGRLAGDVGSAVSVVTGTDNLFGHTAAWPGDGGYILEAGFANLNAWRMDTQGTLTLAGHHAISSGSSSPLVTSNGTQSGAVVWIYERNSHELQAFPAAGVTTSPPIFHDRVGATQDTHFNEVASDAGRVFVAAGGSPTTASHLYVYGVQGLPAVPCNCPGGPNGHNPNAPQGYWEVAADGGIFPWGNAGGYGSTGNIHLNQPVVGMARTPTGRGYWLVAADGGIFPFGDAPGWGSTGNIRLNKPIVGMAAVPGHVCGAAVCGYWLVAADGGIFPFGPGAGGYGSTGSIHLNQPMVGMAATPDGLGYWLVASDGGIFPFGDAAGYGSTGNIRLNQPMVGMAANPHGGGYWLVAADGGIFPFGPGAGGYGSTGNIHLNQPVVGMSSTGDGGGYWLVARDGGIFPFGNAQGYGSTGNIVLNQPMVGITGA